MNASPAVTCPPPPLRRPRPSPLRLPHRQRNRLLQRRPGASAQVRNIATGVSRQAITDDRGFYSFNDLQPGEYSIAISASGFATTTRTGIPIEANSIRRFDVHMQVAQVNETITVEATAAVLQADRADVNV